MIRAVIFDLFGTLVPGFSRSRDTTALEAMAARAGAPADRFQELWHESWPQRLLGRPPSIEENVAQVLERLGLPADPAAVAAAAAVRYGFVRESLVPGEETLEVLKALQAAGLKLGLISDCSPDVPRLWEETVLAGLIDVPVFSSAAGLAKPDARIYRLACRKLRVPPRQCLYVGDGDSDELNGARKVGLRAVLVRRDRSDSYLPAGRGLAGWEGEWISSLPGLLDLPGLPPARA